MTAPAVIPDVIAAGVVVLAWALFHAAYAALDAVHDGYLEAYASARAHAYRVAAARRWHTVDAVIKTLVVAGLSVLAALPPIASAPAAVALAFLALAVRWFVFDAVYNVRRLRPWWYVDRRPVARLDGFLRAAHDRGVHAGAARLSLLAAATLVAAAALALYPPTL